MKQARLRLAIAAALMGAMQHAAAQPMPYPGTLTLSVDLTDSPHRIFRTYESIPVTPGPVTLLYPQWIPGDHAPSGPLDGLSGIRFTAGGKPLAWRRDLVNMYAIHLDIPAGVAQLDMEFQFLAVQTETAHRAIATTAKLAILEWNQVLFYPAGTPVRQIAITPDLTIPAGWGFGTALEATSKGTEASKTRFKTISLEQLVDSPVIAGQNFKRIDLAPGAAKPVFLDLVADKPANLEAKPAQLDAHRALVKQTIALFGNQHYAHYDFLLTLSDSAGGGGLEHHQSSDNGLESEYFTDDDQYLLGIGLLPHEYVHSWNGKFRRPADLTTPDYDQPMQTDLLWVYEGLTQYLGEMLTARAGLYTPEQFRDALASTASGLDLRSGRTWRPLQDTADAAQVIGYAPREWKNWQRGLDYYDEGQLIWLDADVKIRELSKGKRALDDFLKAFHGRDDDKTSDKSSGTPVLTYTFDDIVSALNAVQPYDWKTFFRTRLDATDSRAPLEGINHGGWKLVYTDKPNSYDKALEKVRKFAGYISSLGMSISTDKPNGKIKDVVWNGPAFHAGLVAGMTVVAVNNEEFSADALNEALIQAATQPAASRQPLELLVKYDEHYSTVKIPYYDGIKHPHLERVSGTPDWLGDTIKAQ